MNRTREDFCRLLLDDSPREALDPERLAARFVRYFDVPARPTMDELRSLLKQTGFGEVSSRRHLDVKGIHYSARGGGYDIHYREDMWAGTQDYSVVHETYEIIHETLCDMDSGSPPERAVCTQAERFAAAALMQPRAFEPLALEWGLDVLKLQRAFQCSYAAVTIRLAEVLRDPPLMAVLLRAGGQERPRRLDRPARPAGEGGAPDAGLRDADHVPHLRPAGRRPPQGQAHPSRFPGGAGRPLRQGAIRPRRRLRRHRQARDLDGEAGEGRGHRRARKLRLRPRTPAARLGHARAQAQAGSSNGGSLVALEGRCKIVYSKTTHYTRRQKESDYSQEVQDPHLLPAPGDGGAGAAGNEGG